MKDKLVNEFNKLVDYIEQVGEYIKAFDMFCPQGDLAKEQAIQEFTEVCNKAKKQIDKLRNKQVVTVYER